MSQAFQPGQEVQLRSGGPIMTVVRFAKFTIKEGYECRWFDDKNKLCSDVFTEPELRAVPTGPTVARGVFEEQD